MPASTHSRDCEPRRGMPYGIISIAIWQSLARRGIRRRDPDPRGPGPGPCPIAGRAAGASARGPALRVALGGRLGLRAGGGRRAQPFSAFRRARSPAASASAVSRRRSRTGSTGSAASRRSPRTCWQSARKRRALAPHREPRARQRHPALAARYRPRRRGGRGRPPAPRPWRLRLIPGAPLTRLAPLQARPRRLRRRGRAARGRPLERRGTRMVYTAGNLSLAALEMLVHAEASLLPADLVAIPADIPEGLRRDRAARRGSPAPDWRRNPAPEALAASATRLDRRGPARRCSRCPRRSCRGSATTCSIRRTRTSGRSARGRPETFSLDSRPSRKRRTGRSRSVARGD